MRSVKVRKLEDIVYVAIVMLVTVDKIEQKCIPNTTYGSFRDCLKTGKRCVSHAHLSRSNMVSMDFSLK